jgi:beta-lactamase superfamily II metal-dependent hydrolase
MLKLHVVQAAQGDCLILQGGSSRFVLIDGGPKGNGASNLGPTLKALGVERLSLVILSHVDNDHILGLIEFLAEVAKGKTRASIAALWHNAFGRAVGGDRESRLAKILGEDAVRGYREGGKLVSLAEDLRIPINPGFARSLVTVEGQPKADPRDDLKLTVVAPDEGGLARLRRDWDKWLKKAEEDVVRGSKPALDTSPTNRSSIVVHAACGGQTALLTGDARCDEIQQGLIRAGLSSDGRLHVNLLKVQHHGSRRNARREFFDDVTADKYVVSANGRDGNPDFQLLAWLVDAAYERKQRIELFVTNEPQAVSQLATERPPSEFGYDLRLMRKHENFCCIDV